MSEVLLKESSEMINNKRKAQISGEKGVPKGHELARFRSYSFEKHIEFYKCFSHTFLISISNQNDFQSQWKVMATPCFNSIGVLAF